MPPSYSVFTNCLSIEPCGCVLLSRNNRSRSKKTGVCVFCDECVTTAKTLCGTSTQEAAHSAARFQHRHILLSSGRAVGEKF